MIIEIVVDHPEKPSTEQHSLLSDRVGGHIGYNSRTGRLEFVLRRFGPVPPIAVQSGLDQVAQAYKEAFGRELRQMWMTAEPARRMK